MYAVAPETQFAFRRKQSEDQKRYAQVLISNEFGMQATAPPATTRNTEGAELQRKLDIAEDDIALINRSLDDSQGIYFEYSIYQCVCNLILSLKRV